MFLWRGLSFQPPFALIQIGKKDKWGGALTRNGQTNRRVSGVELTHTHNCEYNRNVGLLLQVLCLSLSSSFCEPPPLLLLLMWCIKECPATLLWQEGKATKSGTGCGECDLGSLDYVCPFWLVGEGGVCYWENTSLLHRASLRRLLAWPWLRSQKRPPTSKKEPWKYPRHRTKHWPFSPIFPYISKFFNLHFNALKRLLKARLEYVLDVKDRTFKRKEEEGKLSFVICF